MGRIEFEASRQAGRFPDPKRGFEPVEKSAESRAFFYPEAAAKSLRELFEDLQRGGLR